MTCIPLCPSVEGDDFETGPFEVTFVAGETTSSSRACVDIGLMDDDRYESDHTFSVTATTASPPAVLVDTVAAVVITIKDDDGEYKSKESKIVMFVCKHTDV